MAYYYQGITDDKPVRVVIIQYADKGKSVEIIRESQIGGRKIFGGFWVNKWELIGVLE